MPVGLGCMRLSTDPDRDETRARATIEAAIEAGITWLDTARAYAHHDGELGHNEALLQNLKDSVTIVTKCGMVRPDGRWEVDGKTSTIRAHAEASMKALGRAPDYLLLHAPDPRVPLIASYRALLKAKRDGLAKAIGLSNVTRGQLDALDNNEEVALVEVALGAQDDAASRGGVVAWCKQRNVPILAHSPLGGPKKAKRIDRDHVLQKLAAKHQATPAEIVIAYLVVLGTIPIVGARTPDAARSIARAGKLVLDDSDLTILDERFPGLAIERRVKRVSVAREDGADVLIIMGGPGSGKSRIAEDWTARGYERLNRDTIGGTLKGIAQRLDATLTAGKDKVVLDNTYLTRASRTDVLEVGRKHGARVRCLFVQTKTEDAQVNIATRMLTKHGALLGGAELLKKAKEDSNLFMPTTLSRLEKTFEPPGEDEGFESIETLPFVRKPSGTRAAIAIPIELVTPKLIERLPPDELLFVFGWQANGERARAILDEGRRGSFDICICNHASGPPVCWCRPPLPGLWVDFARRRDVDVRLSLLIATTPAHRRLASTLGIRAADLADI